MKYIKILFVEEVYEANVYLFVIDVKGKPTELEVPSEVGRLLDLAIVEQNQIQVEIPPAKTALDLARERARKALGDVELVVEPDRERDVRPTRAARKEYTSEPDVNKFDDLIRDPRLTADQGLKVGKTFDAGPDGNIPTDSKIQRDALALEKRGTQEYQKVLQFLVYQADVGTLNRYAAFVGDDHRRLIVQRRAELSDERAMVPQDLLPFLHNQVEMVYDKDDPSNPVLGADKKGLFPVKIGN